MYTTQVWSSLTRIYRGGELDINGYVAVDPARGEVVISFRGSHSIQNWHANFDMGFLPYKSVSSTTAAPTDSQVHRGFARAWMEVRDKVTEALTRAAEALPPDWDRSVRIAGHSLGGAIATPAAAELGERGYTIRTMTYGASRVGNIAFVTWLTAQSHGAISRVTHGGDPVPHLPLMASGYAHMSPEFWIDAGSFQSDYQPSQIKKNVPASPTVQRRHLGPRGHFPLLLLQRRRRVRASGAAETTRNVTAGRDQAGYPAGAGGGKGYRDQLPNSRGGKALHEYPWPRSLS